jgi:hypothetical protein
MLGGYCNHSELTPSQRQNMYNIERTNFVAARTMGANRFMATVLQQNRGSAVGGDDTDMADPVAMEQKVKGLFQLTLSWRDRWRTTWKHDPGP